MPPGDPVNLLVILIISGRQSADLTAQLVREKFYFTQIDSSGGVVQEPTVSLLIGLNDTRMDRLIQLVNECCKPYQEYIPVTITLQPGIPPLPMIEAQMGGALVYSMAVERFEQL